MHPLKERLTTRIAEVRERRPLVDHLVRMQGHYGSVKAGQQAGAITYFAFLSFFPIMALAFFLIGYIVKVFPGAQDNLVQAIGQVLPGLLGTRDDQISIIDVQNAAGAVGLIGLAGVLYAGLGWLSAMRDALVVVFEMPAKEQPNFVFGKLRDLVSLALVGFVLVFSVAVSGLVSGFSQDVLDWVGLGAELGWLLKLLTLALGLGANMVLFFALFKLLAEPHTPTHSLWSGALFGAIGFELLKQLSGLLLASTKGQPAFQAFGIALILLVWINYFSRVVLYSAAFAHTSREARAQRVPEPSAAVHGPQVPALPGAQNTADGHPSWVAPFAAGGAAALGLVAVLRRRKQ